MRPPSLFEEVRGLAQGLARPEAPPPRRNAKAKSRGLDEVVAAIRHRAPHDCVALSTVLSGENGGGERGALTWLRDVADGAVSVAVLREGRPIAALVAFEGDDGSGARLFEAYADIDGVLVDGKRLRRREIRARDVAAGKEAGFVALGESRAAAVIAGAFIATKAGRRVTDAFGRPLFPLAETGGAAALMPPVFAGDPVEVRGAARLNRWRFLPCIEVTGYNAESIGASEDGFLGDTASDRAFFELIDDRRKKARKRGDDPLGPRPTGDMSNSDLDRELQAGSPKSRDFVRATADAFGARLAAVIRNFLGWEYWRGTQRIAIGGGLSRHDIGKRVINLVRKELGRDFPGVLIRPISHHSDDAALLGALHLFHPDTLRGFDAMLAVDIGGTKVRAGIVKTRADRHPDLSGARVWKRDVWRHEGKGRSRDRFVERLGRMLDELAARATRHGVRLAPQIGIACPGVVDRRGDIWRGAQNLPGDWGSPEFNLPRAIAARLPEIDGRRTRILMHNDAVVQGLGELPFMRGVERWGIFTVGTGLGNAHFTGMRHPS